MGEEDAGKGKPAPVVNRHIGWRLLQVLLLGLGFSLAYAGFFINVSMSGAAATMFEGAEVSTVPAGIHLFSSALSLCIAYVVVPRIGQRAMFIAAGLLGAVGAAVMAAGAETQMVGLLFLGTILQGPSFAVAQSFRFVAAGFFPDPLFSQGWRTRAIACTVGCAVFSAALGPEAALKTQNSLARPFTGAYCLMAGLYVAQAVLTGLVDHTLWAAIQQQQRQRRAQARADAQGPPEGAALMNEQMRRLDLEEQLEMDEEQRRGGRRLQFLAHSAALMRVDFWAPAVSGAGAFFTMAAIMGSVPNVMVEAGFQAALGTYTVEAHIGSMYLPALIVGNMVTVCQYLISAGVAHRFWLMRALVCTVFLIPQASLLRGFKAFPGPASPCANNQGLKGRPSSDSSAAGDAAGGAAARAAPPPAPPPPKASPHGSATSSSGELGNSVAAGGGAAACMYGEELGSSAAGGGAATCTYGEELGGRLAGGETAAAALTVRFNPLARAGGEHHAGGEHPARSSASCAGFSPWLTVTMGDPAPPPVPPLPPVAPTAPATFVMALGSAMLLASPGVMLAGLKLGHFMVGMVLAGVGWAFAYVTASSLVTGLLLHDPDLLRTGQSIFDVSVLTLMAASTATAGIIVRLWGWPQFLWLYLAILAALLATNLAYHLHTARRHERRRAHALARAGVAA